MRGFRLLTLRNPKIAKGAARGYLSAVLHLAPFNLSGVNVCPMAELAGCVRACLNTAGRGGIAKGGAVTFDSVTSGERTNTIQNARIRRTRQFLTDRYAFVLDLCDDIARLVRRADRLGLTPCVRLNGTSDIRWEDIEVRARRYFNAPNVFAAFPHVQFYDYTKIPNRRRALGIPNYALTFSYSDRPEFARIVDMARATYGDAVNIAAVFERAPSEFLGRAAVDGDENDLRFLDPRGVVVALTAKGKARRDMSGFVVR